MRLHVWWVGGAWPGEARALQNPLPPPWVHGSADPCVHISVGNPHLPNKPPHASFFVPNRPIPPPLSSPPLPQVKTAKNHTPGFVVHPVCLAPSATVADLVALQERKGFSSVCVTGAPRPAWALLNPHPVLCLHSGAPPACRLLLPAVCVGSAGWAGARQGPPGRMQTHLLGLHSAHCRPARLLSASPPHAAGHSWLRQA